MWRRSHNLRPRKSKLDMDPKRRGAPRPHAVRRHPSILPVADLLRGQGHRDWAAKARGEKSNGVRPLTQKGSGEAFDTPVTVGLGKGKGPPGGSNRALQGILVSRDAAVWLGQRWCRVFLWGANLVAFLVG